MTVGLSSSRPRVDPLGAGKSRQPLSGLSDCLGSTTIDTPSEIAADTGADTFAAASADTAPGSTAGAFRALRHRNFQLFFGGQLTSLIGTWMQSVAQGWLVLKLTNSAFALGLVSFAGYIPVLVVTLFAGVVVDHVDRRRLIIGTQILLMISAFVLAGLSWFGVVRVEQVIILAAFNGLVSAFDMPGRQAFVVDMVGREDLPSAIALNSMIFNGARVIGPAIAGLLIAVIGVSGCFFLNGISYIAVIWSLFEMRVPVRAVTRLGADMMKHLREGLSYIWAHKASWYLLVVVALNCGFAVQYTVLIPVFAQNVLHRGARGYGFLLAAQGTGALIGGLAIASRSEAKALRHNLIFGIFAAAVGILTFGLSHSMWLSLAAQTLVGAGLINHMVTTNTMLQLFVSDDLRGRVMSMYTLSFIGLAPLGSLEVGIIGERVSPQAAVLGCAAIALVCGVVMLSRLKLIAAAQTKIEGASHAA